MSTERTTRAVAVSHEDGAQTARDDGKVRQKRTVRGILGVITAVAMLLGLASSARPNRPLPEVTLQSPAAQPAPQPPVTLRPVSYWENKFLESWDYDRQNGLVKSRLPDSWEHYGIAYDVDANTAMYRATGRKKYLQRALEYVENVVGTARVSSSLPTSQYQDQYTGWVSMRSDLDQPGTEVPLYESYFWRYATTLLRVIRQTPTIYADRGYRPRYERLLRFAEINVFEKWYSRGANDNIYRSRTHMATHWATISLNLALITTDPDRRSRYRTIVDDIDAHMPNYPSSLRGQLRSNPVDPSAYFWSDVWGSVTQPGQDVSHGNAVLSYIVEAKDHGTFWNDADIAAFSTLLKIIWPKPRTYTAFVNGSGTDNGWFSDGFVKLGRYNPAVQQQLERHQVVNAQYAANMALNAKLAS